MILAIFLPTSHPNTSYQVLSESTDLSVQEKCKIVFQDGGHLVIPIGMILPTFHLQVVPILSNDLASFDLQVTLILPNKFQVNWPFDSRNKQISAK